MEKQQLPLTRPVSGKEAVSPPPPPLRTGHESFPSSGSSRFKAPLWTEPVHFHLLEHSSRRHVAMVVRPPSYHGVEPVYQVVLTDPPASIGVRQVFSGESCNPRSRRDCSTKGLTSPSSNSLDVPVIMKSSAYRIRFTFGLGFCVAENFSSSPRKHCSMASAVLLPDRKP